LGGVRADNDDYLRTLAISRLYLDNIPIFRASFLTQHEKGPEALTSGAQDFDIPLEDQVTQLAGAKVEQNVEEVLGWVRRAGLTPIQRAPLTIHP
jgi:cyclic dehypoxanthinyl futalosine synthase